MSLRSAYRESYDRYLALKAKLRGLQELRRKKEEREELLRFQIGEISQADVRAGEDAALLEEKKVLANVQKLIDFARRRMRPSTGRAIRCWRNSATQPRRSKRSGRSTPRSSSPTEEMEELYYRIEEAAFTLRDYAKPPLVRSGPHGGPRRAAGASGSPEAEIRRDARCGHRETGGSGRRSSGISPRSKRRSRQIAAAIADEKARMIEAARTPFRKAA